MGGFKMKAIKKSFILYQDIEEVVDSLTDDKAGRLFKAILDYSRGEKPILSPTLMIVFIPIRQSLDRFKINYEKVSKINSANANKRWNKPQKDAKTSDSMRTNANGYDSDSDSDSDIYKKKHLLKDKTSTLPDVLTNSEARNKAWAAAEQSSQEYLRKVAK